MIYLYSKLIVDIKYMIIYLLCKLLVLSVCGDNLFILGLWISIWYIVIISDVESVMCGNRMMIFYYD